MSNRAWVTLATNDSYGLGALVLAHSLRRAGSAVPAVVLITPSVTDAMRERLGAVFAEVITVDVLDSGDAAHLALLQRPELGITFTKLHCWNLTQYEKCVFLDADTLIVQNCDELFDREELSAAPDVGWPDCFNSGVFVFRPSAETFSNIIKFAQERGSFDGGDQGLLNLYFSDWAHGDINKHLPFLYNVTSAAFYSYLPALKQYGRDLKIIHFIGASKPWLQHYNWRTHTVDAPDHLREFLQLWWSLFTSEVHTKLDSAMVEAEEQTPLDYHHEPEYLEEEYIDQDLNTGHYEATLNPLSEFHWHHPDKQIQFPSEDEPIVDMTEYHDPWDTYRGHIPPMSNNAEQEVPQMDYHEVRKYAWEYMPPVHKDNHSHNAPQIESPFREQTYHETHHSSQAYDTTSSQVERYSNNEYRPEIRQEVQSNHQQHFKQYHAEKANYHHHEPQKPYHNQESYPSNSQYTDRISHLNSNTNQTPSQITHSANNIHKNLTTFSESYSQSNKVSNNKVEEIVIFNNNQEPIHKFTPYVYSVHLDYTTNDCEHQMNGYISDDECDMYEEILPRHPYDGFYLRHQNTIDSRGRKICSHEIHYAPHSPSPTPPSPEVFEDALDFPEEINERNGENHTGVAGHLARIGEDLQSEAIDELSRRQGWEAGNIDYMGADSFDKIWAKISQTLSQGPSSPPKQQSPPLAQPSVGGKDASPLKESPPAPASAPKDLPKEEPQPVPVETSTEKSTPTEPLPASKDTEQKVDVIPSEPVEPVTKELAQPESLPVQIKTDATTLATEETSPQTLERNTEVKAPSEACVPNPTEQSVPLPIEPEKVETQPQDLAKAPEAEPKTLPSESLPKPVEAESKTSPTEDKPAEVEKKELPSETIPAPVEAVDKALPAEVAPTPVESEPKAKQDIVPPKTTEADAMEQIPVPEPTKTEVATSEEKTETVSDIPVSGLEALKLDDKAGASDSPLLATTPSKDEAPAAPAAKSTEEAAKETRL
ncbi:uncharacterized protein LOC121730058 isoform X2 [Aricia agestis]|uniref:uncharacterized protein LOC121730058 isoform X2 n=1 Tax=Aricia agestis TaxID=91739 RepID=UPI001C20203C|nr:uncharacterized protein LOC121730058 isoform X2 [Aricia agestis]XP_041974782.1 uncharacterized protein LOC121730058 isoform X2 [Aricia agestis]